MKLHESLKEMQMKIDETDALLHEERENAKNAIEAAAANAVREIPVVEDTNKIESLTEEVDNWKVCSSVLNDIANSLILWFALQVNNAHFICLPISNFIFNMHFLFAILSVSIYYSV